MGQFTCLSNIIIPIIGTAAGIYRHFLTELPLIRILELAKWHSGKESACQCRRLSFNPWVRKIPWRRKWQPTPVFLPGKSHGQRSLEGYSPWNHKRVQQDLATKQYRRVETHHLQEEWFSYKN